MSVLTMAGADSPSSGRWSSWTRCFRERPVRSLALFYASWKCLVALVVLGCPAPGYDTSTTLLAGSHAVPAISKFIRWDSIYFLQAAQRGYVFEQEWAFSYTYSSLLRWLASGMNRGHPWAWAKQLMTTMAERSGHHGTPLCGTCGDRGGRFPREPCPFRVPSVDVVRSGAG